MGWALPNKTSGAATPLTIPSTTAGNLIVVAIAAVTAATNVTDNAPGGSNSYVQAGSNATVTGGTAAVWYCFNCKAGATAVTLTGVATPDFTVYEVSGMVAGAGVFHTSNNVNSGSASATPLGALVTATATGEFIVAAIWPVNSITTERDISFTLDSVLGGDAQSHITANNGTPGPYTPQWNQNISGIYCAITAAFNSLLVGAKVAWVRA